MIEPDVAHNAESEYPLSAAEKETLARLRGQVERLQAALIDGKKCPNCGADNPPHLWMCWSCHTALIDGLETDGT